MTELTPKRCAEVSPQCEEGHEDAYRLGWWHGQIEMAEEHDGTPCQVIRLRQEIAAVEAERDRLREALERLVELNDTYSPFGGELYRDRVDRTWDNARDALTPKEAEE